MFSLLFLIPYIFILEGNKDRHKSFPDSVTSSSKTLHSHTGGGQDYLELTMHEEQAENINITSNNFKKIHVSALNIQCLSKYGTDIHLKDFVSQFDIIEVFFETWIEEHSDFASFLRAI